MSDFVAYFWEMLETSGVWLIISFTVCGLLHGVLKPEALQKSLGNKKLSSIVKATLSGMLLPMCSCGVLPLAVGLYYSGAYLGPTLAFLVATPIINPASLILSFALLGSQISVIYLLTGFALPVIVGLVANRWGGELVASPYAPSKQALVLEGQSISFFTRLMSGLKWGFEDLAMQTCKYIVLGTVFAAFLLAIMPPWFIQSYLASPELVSLLSAVVLGAVMYVCATGHIPFIAAMVSAGAAPGTALAFLLAGVSTNLPEVFSIWKLIGRRAVFIYTGMVVVFGILAGYAVNALFAENFVPQFDLSQSARSIQLAGRFGLQFPDALKAVCAVVVALVGFYGWALHLQGLFKRRYSP